MLTLDQVRLLAEEAHAGQCDLQGDPFVLHPLAVRGLVESFGGDEIEQMAALLHDVIEDTAISAQDLLDRGVPSLAVQVVQLVSRHEGETYEDFVRRAGALPSSALVKYADVKHNLSRVDQLGTQRASTKRQQYMWALEYLRPLVEERVSAHLAMQLAQQAA